MIRLKYQKLAGLITLLAFLFSVLLPISQAYAAKPSLEKAIIEANGGNDFIEIPGQMIKEKIVNSSYPLDQYEAKFENPKDPCNSKLQNINWVWRSDYQPGVPPYNLSSTQSTQPYTGGKLTYRTEGLYFYIKYKEKDGSENIKWFNYVDYFSYKNAFYKQFEDAFTNSSDNNRVLYERMYIDGTEFEDHFKSAGITEEELKSADKIYVAAIIQIRETVDSNSYPVTRFIS